MRVLFRQTESREVGVEQDSVANIAKSTCSKVVLNTFGPGVLRVDWLN